MALAHPHVFPLLATGPPPSPAALVPTIEATLEHCTRRPGDDEATTGYFWTFLAYTTGALIAECAATVGSEPPSLSARGTADPDLFPNLARLGPALAACDFVVEFERGLDLLISAVGNRALKLT